MAAINWIRLLEQNGIEYVDKGKSTSKGNVYIHCPFCGQADGGHHMGISLSGNAWGCWRNKSHRGKSPVRLLMTLLRISYAAACDIAGVTEEQYIEAGEYEAIKHNLFSKENKDTDRGTDHHIETGLQFPQEFEEITHNRVRHIRFIQYLINRGFKKEHISDLCRSYKLRAATSGQFKDRIILPYLVERNLVSWTGRAIAVSSIRYMDLSVEDSLIPPKHTLFNFNCTRRGGKVLLVAEGPIDSLKLDYYGQQQGVRTVALSTNSISDDQIYLLEEVSVNFEKVLMLMDSANSVGVVDSYRLKDQLAQIRNIGFTSVPKNFKDGGEMPPDAVVKFVKSLT